VKQVALAPVFWNFLHALHTHHIQPGLGPLFGGGLLVGAEPVVVLGGVTGFILSPLICRGGGGTDGGGVEGAGLMAGTRGVGGSILLRASCRYLLGSLLGVTLGPEGRPMGISFGLGEVFGEKLSGLGITGGLGSDSVEDDSAEDIFCIGRPRLSPLESLYSRRTEGARGRTTGGGIGGGDDAPIIRLAAVTFPAAIVAGATERRNPIWTVALLPLLLSRRCLLEEKKGAAGGRR
jgi:hypothetical protein